MSLARTGLVALVLLLILPLPVFGQIDVVFVLDESGSISSSNFELQKSGFAGSVCDPINLSDLNAICSLEFLKLHHPAGRKGGSDEF